MELCAGHEALHSVLGALVFNRLWVWLRSTSMRRIDCEFLSMAMVQGRSPEPIKYRRSQYGVASAEVRDSGLGALVFNRLWGELRSTSLRRVDWEILSVAMVQGRSPEPIKYRRSQYRIWQYVYASPICTAVPCKITVFDAWQDHRPLNQSISLRSSYKRKSDPACYSKS